MHMMMPQRPKYTIEQLAKFSPDRKLLFTSIKVKMLEGYIFTFDFGLESMGIPFLRINTEKRKNFLNKGTESDMEEYLIEVCKQAQKLSGGCFSIHPSYGAVWGTESPAIEKDLSLDISEEDKLNETLKMIIFLSNSDPSEFDDALSDELINADPELGSYDVSDPFSEEYSRAIQKNPNQLQRDVAIANGLGIEYDLEFSLYNSAFEIPKAIEPTPKNIAEFMIKLGRLLGLQIMYVTDLDFES